MVAVQLVEAQIEHALKATNASRQFLAHILGLDDRDAQIRI